MIFKYFYLHFMSFDFYLIALDTFGGKLVLVAAGAVDVMLLMDDIDKP